MFLVLGLVDYRTTVNIQELVWRLGGPGPLFPLTCNPTIQVFLIQPVIWGLRIGIPNNQEQP